VIQDFVAPFYIYLKADYQMRFCEIDDAMNPNFIEIRSKVISKVGEREKRKMEFTLMIKDNKLFTFVVKSGSKTISAKCIG
jgi:hypothetical protein